MLTCLEFVQISILMSLTFCLVDQVCQDDPDF